MDPITVVTISALIVTGVISLCDLVVNLFTALKSGHFKCILSDCCTIEMDDDEDKEKK